MTSKDFLIMKALSEVMTPYESVTWLATPHKRLDNKTPYEMMKANRSTRVYSAVTEDVKAIRKKKKRRS